MKLDFNAKHYLTGVHRRVIFIPTTTSRGNPVLQAAKKISNTMVCLTEGIYRVIVFDDWVTTH
jgi:hypothetical protein